MGEYKNILFEIFDVLGFSDEEKNSTLETFKKKLAFRLLNSLKDSLPDEQKNLISQSDNIEQSKLDEIRETIDNLYSQEELRNKSRVIFKGLLDDYINFMSEDLNPEEREKLEMIVGKL